MVPGPTPSRWCRRGGCRNFNRRRRGLEREKTRATLHSSPSPQQKRAEVKKGFDPAAFAARLSFTDEVAELGITEEDTTRLQIGFTRGRVYFPIRNEDGSVAGFVGYADGQLKMPPQWIGTNVMKLKRA